MFFLRCLEQYVKCVFEISVSVTTDCTHAYTKTEWMKTMKNRPQPTVVYKDISLGISYCPYHKYCQDARSTKMDKWQLQTGSSRAWNSRYFNSVILKSILFFRVMDLPADEFIQWLMKEGLISEQMQCPACSSTCTLKNKIKNPKILIMSAGVAVQQRRMKFSSVRKYSFFWTSTLHNTRYHVVYQTVLGWCHTARGQQTGRNFPSKVGCRLGFFHSRTF